MYTASQPKLKSFRTLYRLLQTALWGGILFTLFLIGVTIVNATRPEEAFEAAKGVAHWSFSVSLSDTVSHSHLVPFTQFQPLSPERFSPKSAYLVTAFSRFVFGAAVYLIAILQLRNLVGSLSAGSPFVPDNVNRLRRLAFVIIAYSVLSNIFMSAMYWLFVHDVFSINVAVSLKGLGIGLLVLCIAEVFRHGVYLQEEVDTTL